jgi:Tfp pilus assembly protein PilZ
LAEQRFSLTLSALSITIGCISLVAAGGTGIFNLVVMIICPILVFHGLTLYYMSLRMLKYEADVLTNVERKKTQLADRRRSFRMQEEMDIIYKVLDKPEITGKCKSKDISESGMKLALDKNFPIGTKLDLEIKMLYDSRPLYAIGEVVWLNKSAQSQNKGEIQYEAGVKFIEMKSSDRLRIIMKHTYDLLQTNLT